MPLGHFGTEDYRYEEAMARMRIMETLGKERSEGLAHLKERYGDQLLATSRSEILAKVWGRTRRNATTAEIKRSVGMEMSVAGHADGPQPKPDRPQPSPKQAKPKPRPHNDVQQHSLKGILRPRRIGVPAPCAPRWAPAPESPEPKTVTFEAEALQKPAKKWNVAGELANPLWKCRRESTEPETPEELGYFVSPKGFWQTLAVAPPTPDAAYLGEETDEE